MEEKSLVKVDPKEFGLDESQAQEIEQHFTPVVVERDNLAEIYTEIVGKEISPETTTQARELRLKLVKVRTNTDKIHKTQKAFYLAGGRFCDAWKNKTIIVLEQMEEKLLSIENYYINIEKEKAEKLKQERILILSEFCENPESYPLGLMSEDAFNNLVEGQKLIIKQRQEKAKKAEKERVEAELREAKERERIRIENEKLRKENEAKELQLRKEREEAEKKLAEERVKAESERKVVEEKNRKEREEAERLAKIESDKQAKIIAEQKAQQERIQAELDAKRAADNKIKAEKEKAETLRIAEEKRLAKAPDKEKLSKWLDNIKCEMIDITTLNNDAYNAATDIIAKFEAFKNWAKSQINNL
jgi:hypothetical protein